MGIIVLFPPAQSTCSNVPVNVRIFWGEYLGGGIFLLFRSAQSICFIAQVKVEIIFQEYFRNTFPPPSCTAS